MFRLSLRSRAGDPAAQRWYRSRGDKTSPFPPTGNEGYIRQGLLYGLSGAVLTSTSRRLKVSRDLDTGAISCPISESVDPSSVESAREGLSRGASVPRTRSEWASRVPRAGPGPHPPWPCTVFVSGGAALVTARRLSSCQNVNSMKWPQMLLTPEEEVAGELRHATWA